MDDSAYAALGDFLRSRRERLLPERVGLSSARRRRTPGLRREEVAELAGIGVDWYIRLEQGRPVNPSAATIRAPSRALKLSSNEALHLQDLARRRERVPFVREVVPAGIQRTVEALNVPAYITGRRWDVLAWNTAAAEVFGFDRIATGDRNTLIQVLTNPKCRALFGASWSTDAKRMVEQFRATYDMWAGDPAFVELLDRLRLHCPEFEAWWETHALCGTSAGRKRLNHPRKGTLKLEYSGFQSNDDPSLKLVIYSA